MRILLLLTVLLVASPAFALSDALVNYCLTTPNPKSCLIDMMDTQQRHQLELQQRQVDAQVEAARQQAEGLALFGTGPALIQGMNQGFNNMRIPPPIPAQR